MYDNYNTPTWSRQGLCAEARHGKSEGVVRKVEVFGLCPFARGCLAFASLTFWGLRRSNSGLALCASRKNERNVGSHWRADLQTRPVSTKGMLKSCTVSPSNLSSETQFICFTVASISIFNRHFLPWTLNLGVSTDNYISIIHYFSSA